MLARFSLIAAFLVAGCNATSTSSPSAPATAVASADPVASVQPMASAEPAAPSTTTTTTTSSARGAVVKGLRAEIVPVIGGLFQSAPADPQGKPVTVPWVLRITNTTDKEIVFRTGGDDESFEITVTGSGVASATLRDPCPEIYFVGKKNVIPAKGSLDLSVNKLASGVRCKQTSYYLTAPGLYSIDITLNGHIHDSAAPFGKGERGEPVRLEAPTITIKAS